MPLALRSAVADEDLSEGYVHWIVASGWPGAIAAHVERRFDELIHTRWRSRTGDEPPADVFLVGRELWVEVDLPGIDESQVQVRVEPGLLVIEARRELALPAREAEALQRERTPGVLRRRLRLPLTFERPACEVRCECGVLRVRIRSSDEETGR